jgi:hypothetical protein
MRPERTAGLVARWVRFYTRDLPADVAERRIGEIDADLHDHIAHERAGGTEDRRIALGILARMVRGLAADASWRGRMAARPSTGKEVRNMSKLRVPVATALILLVPLVWMQFSDDARWSVADFVLAGVVLGGTGLLLEYAVRNPRKIAYRVAAVAIAVAAIVVGEMDDAPGLVLFGCLVIGGTVALTVRNLRTRSG